MRILLSFLILITLSCSPKNQNIELEGRTELQFKKDSLHKEICVGGDCAKLSLSWPVTSGPAATEKINMAIQDQIAMLIQTGEDSGHIDTLITRYLSSFEEFKTSFPDSNGGWEIEVEAQVSYESDSTLSIYFTQFSSLGGAHPNSNVTFLNFNASSGDILSLDQLVLDENVLLELAEKKFREFHEVAKGVSIQDDGRFFLPETGFFLPNAMGFKDGKFWIIYVPYEIGPYVMGYTELEFSREELKGIVRW